MQCSIPKNCGHKSSIDSPNQEARDKDTSRYPSTMGPTSNEEIEHENNPESGQSKGTCINNKSM